MSLSCTLAELATLHEQQSESGTPLTWDEVEQAMPSLATDSEERKELVAFMEKFLSLPTEQNQKLISTAIPSTPIATFTPKMMPEVSAPPGFEIISKLGQGGMGVVYKARQTSLKRLVALKMILPRGELKEAQLQRFALEAQAIARLQHPNIVQIHEHGEHDGKPYFSLELVHGGSLADLIRKQPQSPKASAKVVAAIAEGMAAVHQCGIIHRDLKPANVLMSMPQITAREETLCPLSDAVPKITDFGLAKQLDDVKGRTVDGALMGTPQYMAPEQAEGRVHDFGPHTDVYALGAILYEMLTGRPPFNGETHFAILHQVSTMPPVAPRRLQPECPLDLEVICLKALEKDPKARYESAQAMADDLNRYLRGEPIVARPIGAVRRAVKWAKRRPAAAGLLLAILLSVVGAIGGLIWHSSDLKYRVTKAEDQARRAEQREQRLRDENNSNLASAEALSKIRLSEEKALEAQALMIRGRTEQAQNLWGAIETLLAQAETRTRPAELNLHQLHTRATKALKDIQRERQRAERFIPDSATAIFDLVRLVSGEPTVRDSAVREVAWRALGEWKITPDNNGKPVIDPRFYDEETRGRITGQCYELLVLLALVENMPNVRPNRTAEQRREASLKLLERANGLGLQTRSYHVAKAALLPDPADRAAELKQSLAVSPHVAADYFLMGLMRYLPGSEEKDRFSGARRSFDLALRARPEHFWAKYFRVLSYLQESAEKGEGFSDSNWEGVLVGLSHCIAQKPDFIWSYILRANAYGELAGRSAAKGDNLSAQINMIAAVEDFQTALNLKPSRLEQYAIHNNWGTILARRGKPGEALVQFDKAVALYDDRYPAHLGIARALADLKKYPEALKAIDKAIECDDSRPSMYRLRARLALNETNADLAIASYRKAIELANKIREERGITEHSRQLAEDHVLLGKLLWDQKKTEPALEAIQKARDSDPNYGGSHLLELEIHMARGKLNLIELPALAYIGLSKETPTLTPPNASVYRAMGLALAEENRDYEALESLTRSLLIEENASTYVARGWLHIRNEAPLHANHDFKEALRLEEDRLDARIGLGMVDVIRGRYQVGLKAVEEALTNKALTELDRLNIARTYAMAIPRVENDPQILQQAARQREVAEHAGKAVELIRKVLAQVPKSERARFWNKRIAADKLLNELRKQPIFRKLEQEIKP